MIDCDICHWRGIRFKRVEARRDELQRFESDWGDFGHSLWQTKSGQWLAMFNGGTYSVERTPEDALRVAALSAIDMLRYSADCLESRLLDWAE